MINKIKDFLKNVFRKKTTDDFSDQSETHEFDEAEQGQLEDDDFGPAEPNFGPPENRLDISQTDFDPLAASSNESESEELTPTPLEDTGIFEETPIENQVPEKQTGPMQNLLLETQGEDQPIEEVQERENEIPATEDLPETTNVIPNFTSSYNRSELEETAESDNRLTWKDKMGAFFSRLRFRMEHIKFKKPDLSNIKMPDFKKASSQGGPMLSPSMAKNIDKFLSRESRETIHQTTLVFLICGFVYTLGKISALVMRGAPALETAKNFSVEVPLDQDFNPMVLNQVKSINIFRTGSGSGGPKKLADTKCEEAQQASSLPIKLVNTVVLQDTIKSMASVQIRGDRDLQEVREGENIDTMAKIFRISRLEILVKNLENGMCESIAAESAEEANSPIQVMSPSASRQFKAANKKMQGIENVGNKFVISKTLLDDKMKDISAILTQARAVKIQNPDGSLAFKMTEMDPNGIFTYLGLQDGDIITSIDGKAIYDMNEVMTKFAKIRNLDKLQLGIRREGSESLQDYTIKK